MSGNSPNTTRPPWALGQCDICGFHYRLNQLKAVIFDQRPTGSLACPTCWDLDNPQLQLGRMKIYDPQSLRNPRPDLNRPSSTSYFGWNPIGGATTLFIQCQVGNITVLVT
jgi:hypothetical protein